MKNIIFVLKWLAEVLIDGFAMFIIASVSNKLFFNYQDWIYQSLVFSIAWLVGMQICKVSKLFHNDKDSIKEIIMFNIGIIIIVFFVTAFVTGVLLNIPTWYKIEVDIIIPFGLSLFLNVSLSKKKINI